MVQSGRIISKAKAASIQGATVTVLDAGGNDKGISTTTNEVGYFYFNNPGITLTDHLLFEHPLFYPKDVPIAGSTGGGFVSLDEKPVIQEVAPNAPASVPVVAKTNYWWLAMAVIAGVIILSPKKRR